MEFVLQWVIQVTKSKQSQIKIYFIFFVKLRLLDFMLFNQIIFREIKSGVFSKQTHCGKTKTFLSPHRKKYFVKFFSKRSWEVTSTFLKKNFREIVLHTKYANFTKNLSLHCTWECKVWKLREFSLTLFWKKYRESNSYTKQVIGINFTKFFFGWE